MNPIERRSFLKGLVVTAVAAAVAPVKVPAILEAIPRVQKMRCFVPISIELLGDFPNVDDEMRRLFMDSFQDLSGRRDVKFLGSGRVDQEVVDAMTHESPEGELIQTFPGGKMAMFWAEAI